MIDAMHRPEQALAEVRRLLPARGRQIDHHAARIRSRATAARRSAAGERRAHAILDRRQWATLIRFNARADG
jgi:hypothetical protein